MDPVFVSKQLGAASANSIALSQSLGAAGPLTLNGALATAGVATLDTQRRILLTSAADDHLITWTVRGTNGAHAPISETLAGGNGVAVATNQDFLTVSSITASGATAGAVIVGTNTTASTAWQVPNFHITPFELSIRADLLSGSATFTIEATDDDPRATLRIYPLPLVPIPVPYVWPGLGPLSGNSNGMIDAPVPGWRLTITAGTGLVRVVGVQAGIRN